QLRAAQRRDRGVPKVLPEAALVHYCELVAAIKLRTANQKGRHLPTTEAIRLLEDYGLDTPQGFVRAPRGVLTKPTVNRYLRRWGLDRERLTREPPAVRFQAEHSSGILGPAEKIPHRAEIRLARVAVPDLRGEELQEALLAGTAGAPDQRRHA
ncbi:MAG: hypothetical protein P8Y27_14370, partial [Chromatiaceae bacterium]